MKLLVYTPFTTSRLEYTLQTVFAAIGLKDWSITTNQENYTDHQGAKLNYSHASLATTEVWIEPAALLFEEDIRVQPISCFEYNGNKAFFKIGGASLPFDVFAASFYLLSRYEEYLPHNLDLYGRYAHENSLAFKEGFLQLPLVNIWFQQLQQLLHRQFPSLQFKPPSFTYIPTYDIDIAWSYKHKGLLRNAGASFKSLIKGDWQQVKERIEVLAGRRKDPFDVYDWLDKLHTEHKLSPLYFFLLGSIARGYDKNISPRCAAMRTLVNQHSAKYKVGIHPSWASGDNPALLHEEINDLNSITGQAVTMSRQHYIRMHLPSTYRQLINAGIRADYSMGYGSINGFRASYCMPYYWFDLEKNEATELNIFPFSYMEANSLFEQHLTPAQALEELNYFHAETKKTGGTFITIFHNHLLTEQPQQMQWRKMYQQFLQQVITS